MFAVERVSCRKYAICRLTGWAQEEHLTLDAKICQEGMDAPNKRTRSAVDDATALRSDDNQQWWRDAAVEVPVQAGVTNEHECLDPSMPVLDMRPMEQKAPRNPQPSNISGNTAPATNGVTIMGEELIPAATVGAQSSQDILHDLAKHYLEALYISRTSLNYFTKGPLSRARAAATNGGFLSVPELIDFLRPCILASAVMDKKYRDGISGIVKGIPVRGPADSSPVLPKKKKKRKWKLKRDKSGLFTDEQEFVERWWRDTDHDESPGTESAVAVLRKRIATIRNRETFLQIILCLEVLALESSMSGEIKKEAELFTAAKESQDLTETQQEDTQATDIGDVKPAKPKKKQDLHALLENLLDKLTIWHSLESSSSLKTRTESNAAVHEHATENDELRSFCLDVIIPFYVSRIPQQANVVNKKLGGPSAPSPVKRRTSSKNLKDTSRKPGEPAIRQLPPEKKSRQPLSRISSEMDRLPLTKRHSMPSLQRSYTDSDTLLAHVKRETSENAPSLDSIPPLRPQRSSRASLMSSLSRREVDFTAMSAASEAKLKKKADVEEKLGEAISTLKKPNRAAAVKEVAENADASFAKALARGKVTTMRGRAGGLSGVAPREVITATPSRHRKVAKVVKATPYHGQGDPNAHEALNAPSSGSSALVPSSSAHLNAEQPLHLELTRCTPAIPATGHRPRHHSLHPQGAANAVEDTPSRGFARFMPPGLVREPGTLDSPIASRKAAIEQTPSKPLKSISFAMSTPLRQAAPAGPLVEASPNCVVIVRQEQQVIRMVDESVYTSLGWDDEEYEQLA